MAKRFNISQLLNGASLQAGENPAADAEKESIIRPMLKIIPIKISDLIPSRDNFYSVDKIDELKTSIEMYGVMQSLLVKPLDGGKYEIIAGHRRHCACMELAEEGKTEFEYIPCGIQAEQEQDEIKERILLIMTNSTTRELTDWEKMKQAEEMQKYLTILKKRDNLPGRIRDLAAEALNTSSTQIARMNAITNNLTEELKSEFQAGKIGMSAAYELSGLPEEKQQEAAAELQEKGVLSINEVKDKKQEVMTAEAEAKHNKKCVICGNELTEEEEYYYEIHCEDCERILNKTLDKESRNPATATTADKKQSFPETPEDFKEGGEDEEAEEEIQDFADMSAKNKAEAAIEFLNKKRFILFTPGEDSRILDYIIGIVEQKSRD